LLEETASEARVPNFLAVLLENRDVFLLRMLAEEGQTAKIGCVLASCQRNGEKDAVLNQMCILCPAIKILKPRVPRFGFREGSWCF